MRFSLLTTLPLLGALAVLPRQAPAQVSISLHLGTPVVVTNYAPESYGDWHTGYRGWTPVTLYSYNGQWYPRQVRGSRAVTVYRSQNRYFLPPRTDQGWTNQDRRISAQRRPTDEDYTHAAPPPPPRGRGQAAPPPPSRTRPSGGQ